MELDRLQTNWTNLGSKDPLWAILSDPGTRGGRWDLEAFLRTGRDFVGYLARIAAGLGVELQRRRALDFGCGYGRMTQALGEVFDEVVGVDIAESMLAGARSIDRSGGRCRFVHNTDPDLRQFADASFDFVHTVLVLQHMRPDYACSYVREFLRVLRPGGFAFFQVPSVPLATALATPPSLSSLAAAPPVGDLGELRSAISLHPGMLALHVGAWTYVRLQLHNFGAHTLAATGPGRVRIGLRWHAVDGTPLAPASWHALSRDVAPGASAALLLPTRAPQGAESAVLHALPGLDDAWIETATNAPARAVAMLTPGVPAPDDPRFGAEPPPAPQLPLPTPVATGGDEAEIEVHGVPVPAVVALVRAAGGEVLDVVEDCWAGVEWISAHYSVRKR